MKHSECKNTAIFLPKNMRGARSFKDERVNGVDPDEMVHYEPLDLYSGLKVIENFSCSTQLSMKIFLLINVKMPTVIGILTYMSRKKSIPG